MTKADESTELALAQLGWKPFFSEQLSAAEDGRYQPVRVMSVHQALPV